MMVKQVSANGLVVGKSFAKCTAQNHITSLGINTDTYKRQVQSILNTTLNPSKWFEFKTIGYKPLYFFCEGVEGKHEMYCLASLEYDQLRKIGYLSRK